MVESKHFWSETDAAASPPLVPVAAAVEWDLPAAMPVPSAPSYLYDESQDSTPPSNMLPDPMITPRQETSHGAMRQDTAPPSHDDSEERQLTVGAGVASGVVGL